jgi:hypothetical protein
MGEVGVKSAEWLIAEEEIYTSILEYSSQYCLGWSGELLKS